MSDVGRGVSGVFTLGTSEIARNNLGKNSIVSKVLQTPGTIFTGGTSKFGVAGAGGSSYTPTMLQADDPKLVLSQTGGAPLLAQIALGVPVDDALAGYFGRTKGADWEAFKANMTPDEQASIESVHTQLTDIQTNSDLRDKAVQQVVNDFPNLTKQLAPQIQAMRDREQRMGTDASGARTDAKSAAGQEFDAASQKYLEYAMNATGAKYAANGQVSSGAMVEAQARNAAQLGLDRLNYTTSEGDKAYGQSIDQGNRDLTMQGKETDIAANDILGAWQARYSEVNALRSFQQKMLGQGAQNGFSATQAALDRKANVDRFNADAINKKNLIDSEASRAEDNAVFGALGNLAGTAAAGYFMGPAGAMAAKTATGAGSVPAANSAMGTSDWA